MGGFLSSFPVEHIREGILSRATIANGWLLVGFRLIVHIQKRFLPQGTTQNGCRCGFC